MAPSVVGDHHERDEPRVADELSNGFTRVTPTDEEEAEFRAKHHGHPSRVYRSQCNLCGKRIWHSGLAVVSHRRVCR